MWGEVSGYGVEVSVLRAADPFWDEHLVQDGDVIGAEWHSRSGGVLAYVRGAVDVGGVEDLRIPWLSVRPRTVDLRV